MDNFQPRNTAKVVDFGDEEHVQRRNTGDHDHDHDHDADIEAQRQLYSSGTSSVNRLIGSHHRHGHGDEPRSPVDRHITRTGTDASKTSIKSLRRRGRAETHTAYGAEEMGRSTGWAPGLEPGIDTSDPPPYEQDETEHQDIRHLEQLHQQCEIMIVDYSSEQMKSQLLDNENLKDFLAEPQEDWGQVRWINVNGLSWDVIKELGNHKKLHRLAIEDLMNTRNRTKADWYHDHTYMVLPLAKLVNVEDEYDSSDSDSDNRDEEDELPKHDYDEYVARNGSVDQSADPERIARERRRRRHELQHMKKQQGAFKTLIKDIFRPPKQKRPASAKSENLTKSSSFKNVSKVKAPWAPRKVRTLQQYHSGPNQDRTEYMQRHSTLGKKGLGVSMEQVSIFLTADNTVISFFEYSAQDIELPIMRRLQSKSTILRQSCDASMLMQSILDTIVDMSLPCVTAYQDAMGDLELEVLTDPAIKESTALYILTSEIANLRGAIAPLNQLIGALKDHKSSAAAFTMPARVTPVATPNPHQNKQLHTGTRPAIQTSQTQRSQLVSSGVQISPLTIQYLADVEDHAQIVQDAYDQMRRSADNLSDLVFNTTAANQNESMKQLTIVNCFFLPLTFMAGYFGMNFETFPGVQEHSDKFFWGIAAPVCGVLMILLLQEPIRRWFIKWAQKSLIKRGRKRRLERSLIR